ncbi:MAG: RNA pseudouridine synthase [Bacteroidota bacterium]|nr:RNA pseudouridine synthase [Bacteroidota bacterium]
MKKNNPLIIYEDNHLIAAYKLSGQTVQPEPNKPRSLEEQVKIYLKEKYQKEGAVFLGVIHRIDMPVSGLVLFAKTSKALTRMNEIFHDRLVQKIYLAKVEGKPKLKTELITHWLRRDENKNFTKAFTSEVKGAQIAKLTYEIIESNARFSLLKINLHTGRKHQVRAQLSALGCPIAGDVKYGASQPMADQSIALQSYSISFIHPVKLEPIELILNKSVLKL